MNRQEHHDKFTVNCDSIQEMLTDYMHRELGESHAMLVREHLRRCDKCRAAARNIADALDLLRAHRSEKPVPTRLSEAHRKRIFHAITHPVMHWMDTYHTAISIAVVIVLAAVVLCFLRKVRIFNLEEIEPGVPVRVIDRGGEAPALDTVSPTQEHARGLNLPDASPAEDKTRPRTNSSADR